MDVAFVKNSENHIHDKDGGNEKQRQRLEQLTEDKCFALKRGLHARELLMHLRERIFDELSCVTDGDVRAAN